MGHKTVSTINNVLNRYPELKYHCLGMVFTGQKFDRGTLGASYTPDSTSLHPLTGICDGFIPNVGTMNGLVITASTVYSPLVNQMIFEVTIAHELGNNVLISFQQYC